MMMMAMAAIIRMRTAAEEEEEEDDEQFNYECQLSEKTAECLAARSLASKARG